MRKIFGVLAALLTAAALSGCYAAGSADNMLSPPKLSEEQTDVYNALIKSVGSEIRLRYPRSGEYRSAFVFADIDGEPDREAIVFYEKAGEIEGGGNVRVNIIDRREGKWTSVYDHAGAGTGVDRVLFAELGGSGRQSVIIGYTLLSGEKSVQVYSYGNGVLNSEFSDTYTTMFTSDLERNGKNELIIIRTGNQQRKATVNSVSFDSESGTIAETGSVALDESAKEFVNIAAGYVGSGETPAIFIDGLSGGQLTTEIIYSVDGQLRNPLYLGQSNLIENTRRQTGYPCTDIDLDGVIEIPTLSLFPGYAEDMNVKFYSTDWNIFDNYTITKKYSSFYDIASGYCFILPSRWDGVVTVKRDAVTGETVFYKFRVDLLNSATELMRINTATEEETPALLEEGYMVLKSNNRTNYLVKCPDISDEPLILTGTEISNNFYIMANDISETNTKKYRKRRDS